MLYLSTLCMKATQYVPIAFHRDRAAGANVCDSDSDATHDLPTQHTPTNLENKFSESTTTITKNTTEEQQNEKRQELLRTTSEDEEDLSDSRQTGVSSADNSFASAARGLGECEPITTCAARRCCCEKLSALALTCFAL